MEQKKVRRCRFDAHFHPQTSRFHIRKKVGLSIEGRLKKWWDTFRENKIQVIVSTEHAYVNPAEGYYLMKQAKPIDYDAVLLPGVETVSREGIDLLVWSKDESIFDDERVMMPFLNPIENLVEIIAHEPRYQGSIPHPFGTTPSSAFSIITPYDILRLGKTLGLVESYNFMNQGMYNKENLLGRVMGGVIYPFISRRRIRGESFRLQEGLNKEAEKMGISFSMGNDAHNPQDVKCYGLVDVDGELTADAAFDALRRNKDSHINFLNAYAEDKLLYTLIRSNPRLMEELMYYYAWLNDAKNGNDKNLMKRYRENKSRFRYDDLQ